jgi:hypothetical protein
MARSSQTQRSFGGISRKKYGVDFDAALTPERRAIAWAFEEMAQDISYWALLDARWMDHANLAKGPALFFFRSLAGADAPTRRAPSHVGRYEGHCTVTAEAFLFGDGAVGRLGGNFRLCRRHPLCSFRKSVEVSCGTPPQPSPLRWTHDEALLLGT